MGFPGDSVVENPPFSAGCLVDGWVGKILWRRKWQPTPVFLPGESHGQRSLAGYSPLHGVQQESGTTELLENDSSLCVRGGFMQPKLPSDAAG